MRVYARERQTDRKTQTDWPSYQVQNYFYLIIWLHRFRQFVVSQKDLAQLAAAIEYTHCTFAEG